MEEDYGAFIEDRRAEILQRVDASLAVGGRTRDEVELVAVSKTVGLMQVLTAIDAGYRVFGENRPQELHRKLEGLELVQETRPVRFDMIGNLQTNKINAVLGRVELIHSIGTMHLAEAVSRRVVWTPGSLLPRRGCSSRSMSAARRPRAVFRPTSCAARWTCCRTFVEFASRGL